MMMKVKCMTFVMWEKSVSFLDESEIKADVVLMLILSLTSLFGRSFLWVKVTCLIREDIVALKFLCVS